jgi:hypothetical protein
MEGPISLADLPPEVLDMIARCLDRPRDAAAAAMATRAFWPSRVVEILVRRPSVVDPIEAIKAGAPLEASRVLDTRCVEPTRATIAAAVGGRPDVFSWYLERTGPVYLTTSEVDDLASAIVRAQGTEMVDLIMRHRVRVSNGWIVERMASFAGARGRVDIVALMYEGSLVRYDHLAASAPRDIALSAWESAIEADQVEVICWIHENCTLDGRTKGFADAKALSRAVFLGSVRVARWMASALVGRDATGDQRIDAVDCGHASGQRLETMIVMHAAGLLTITRSNIMCAADHGNLDLLRWAAGDAVEGIIHGDRNPIPEWNVRWAAWGALRRGRLDVVQWVLTKRDAPHAIGVEYVRVALARGHIDIALAIHNAGLVRLCEWESLRDAVRSDRVDVVRAVADAGSPCSWRTLAAALKHASPPVVDYLCDRFGTAEAQRAVDAVATRPGSGMAVERLRAIVGPDDLCVAAAQGAAHSLDSAPATWDVAPCSCRRRRCRPRLAADA